MPTPTRTHEKTYYRATSAADAAVRFALSRGIDRLEWIDEPAGVFRLAGERGVFRALPFSTGYAVYSEPRPALPGCR